MKRKIWRLAIFGLLVTPLFMSGSCAEETPALFIVHNALLRADCQPETAHTSARSRGRMDLTVARTYNMFLMVENVMSASGTVSLGGGSATGNYEGNRVTFRTAKISFVPRTTNAAVRQCLLVNQEIGISGTLEPNQQTLITLQAMDHNRGDCLRGALRTRGVAVEVDVQIQFVGYTASGTEVSSNLFNYPMTVCRGCLIKYPLEATDTSGDIAQPNCARSFLDEDGNLIGEVDLGCYPGQDDMLDCRVCKILVASEGQNPTAVNQSCEPVVTN